jgi:predicted anti-sigma-YlaC factor YlaD
MNRKKLFLHLGHIAERTLPGLITCAEADRFVVDYLDSRLTPKMRARFERHIKMCAPCRAYLEAYRRSVDLAKASTTEEDAPSMPEELVQAILAARDPSRH